MKHEKNDYTNGQVHPWNRQNAKLISVDNKNYYDNGEFLDQWGSNELFNQCHETDQIYIKNWQLLFTKDFMNKVERKDINYRKYMYRKLIFLWYLEGKEFHEIYRKN